MKDLKELMIICCRKKSNVKEYNKYINLYFYKGNKKAGVKKIFPCFFIKNLKSNKNIYLVPK